jgi:hypothetical protein
MRKIIIFLIRMRLGLAKYEKFRFAEQKSSAIYYFTESNLMKYWRNQTMLSGVSLNWILDTNCKIERV